MWQRRRFVIASMLASALVASSARAQTVDEILAKNLEALGGRAALDRVQSVRQTSRLVLPGSEATVVVFSKRPNLIRQELRVAGETAVSAFDGSVAWTVNRVMGWPQPTTLSGAQADALRNQSSFEGLLAAARTRGDHIELIGTATMRGRSAYHFRITAKDHQLDTQCYLDAETFLEVRTVSDSSAGRFEQDLLDYRPVEGIMMPFTIRTSIAGRPAADIVVSKVEVNVSLDDDMFRMPKARTSGTPAKVTTP